MNLEKSFIKNKNKIAIISKGINISYKKIYEDTKKIFKKIDKKKYLILIEASNSEEFFTIYSGCIINKKSILLVNKNITQKSLDLIVNLYKPKYLFLNTKKYKFNYKKIYKIKDHELLETNFKIKYQINKNLALLLSTSGSLSSPKYVRISYKNLNDNTNKIINYLKIVSSDRSITTLNPSYSFGLSIINSHFIAGASLILNEDSILKRDFWDLFRKYKPNSFNGVPYMFELLQKLNFDKLPLKKLKYMTSAGGKLNEDLQLKLINYLKNKKTLFYIMYGQTEASPRMSYLEPKFFEKKIGSIGKPLPGGRFILKDTFKNIQNKIIGEIVYKGKNVSLGYASSFKDLKKGDKNFNILKTGDLASKDKEGFYYIEGRKGREVKLYGNRFNLDEIEKKLYINGIKCACLLKEKQILIFLEEENKKISEILKRLFSFNISIFLIKKIKKIPVTSNKKTNYKLLEKSYV